MKTGLEIVWTEWYLRERESGGLRSQIKCATPPSVFIGDFIVGREWLVAGRIAASSKVFREASPPESDARQVSYSRSQVR